MPVPLIVTVKDPKAFTLMGKEGVRLMIEGSEDLPLRVYFAIPSCVPSVEGKETAGAFFTMPDAFALAARLSRCCSAALAFWTSFFNCMITSHITRWMKLLTCQWVATTAGFL